jgi:hypothetical protein
MESFPKTKLLVDEFINDQVNDEIEWTFHGFELKESTWDFQIKTKIGPIVWFHCFKNMVIIGKVFQEGFLFVIKSFLKNKEELQPNIDLLTLDYLNFFF